MTLLTKKTSFASAVALSVSSLFGAVFYASPDGKSEAEGGDGTLSNPYTLRQALGKGGWYDEVRLLESDQHYVLTADTAPIRRTLVGWNGETDSPAGREGRSRVIIDGDEKYCLKCHVQGDTYGATYRDLTIVRGYNASGGAGGMFFANNLNDPLVFSNVVFTGACKQWHPFSITVKDASSDGKAKFLDCDFNGLTCANIGGGFLATTGAIFDGCRFVSITNNYASSLDSLGTFTRCAFTNCIFSGNIYAGYGAIKSSGSRFFDCVFTNNACSKSGSCFMLTAAGVSLDHCRFFDNRAGEYGGCFFGGFRGANTSTDSEPGGRLYATNCVFVGNSCAKRGGVLATRSRTANTDDDWRFVGCAFTNNVSEQGDGSCLYMASMNVSVDALVRGCDFCENGKGACVAPCDHANVVIDTCTFTGNVKAVSHSGREDWGYYYSKIDLRNSQFVGNTSTFVGMGTISNCQFRACPGTAVAFYAGDGSNSQYRNDPVVNKIHDCLFEDVVGNCIRQTYGKLEVTDCVFTNNHDICLSLTHTDASYRSYWYYTDVGELKVERCRFVGNVSAVPYRAIGRAGTAILHCAANSEPGYVRNCLFLGNTNTVTQQGMPAAIVQVGSNTVVDACTFVRNHSQGGTQQALYPYGDMSEGRVRNCAFHCNTGANPWTGASGGTFTRAGAASYVNCFDTYGWLKKASADLDGKTRGNIGGSWSSTMSSPMDPRFATDDCQPSFGSPLVDAGVNGDWMVGASDFRRNPKKFPRIFNGIVDIGCWECVPSPGLILMIR